MQSVGVLSTVPLWHEEHWATRVCPPVSSKPVVVWLNVEGFQAAGVWHLSHCTGIPAAGGFGFMEAV